jgi:hypothetical protein
MKDVMMMKKSRKMIKMQSTPHHNDKNASTSQMDPPDVATTLEVRGQQNFRGSFFPVVSI